MYKDLHSWSGSFHSESVLCLENKHFISVKSQLKKENSKPSLQWSALHTETKVRRGTLRRTLTETSCRVDTVAPKLWTNVQQSPVYLSDLLSNEHLEERRQHGGQVKRRLQVRRSESHRRAGCEETQVRAGESGRFHRGQTWPFL